MDGDEEAGEVAVEVPHWEALPPYARERVRLRRAEARIAAEKLSRVDVSLKEEVAGEGYPSLAAFFAAALAMTRAIESFIHFIAMFHFHPSLSDAEMVELALRRLMRIAVEANEPFIRGKAYLDPLAAARWIDSLPSERGLLPPELRDFLAGEEEGPLTGGQGLLTHELAEPAAAAAPPVLLLSPPVCPPGDGATEAEPRRSNNASKVDLVHFLKDRASKQITKDELFELAKAHFADRCVTERAFKAAYQQVPPEQRRERGETARTLKVRDNRAG